MTAPIVALACDPTSQYGGGRPEVTAGTVAETRVMVAAMTAVEREAALKEGGLMEEVKVAAMAVMVATLASAEKRVGQPA